jgi:dipeptidase E
VDLLGKPIAQSKALLVPTAIYTYPEGSVYAWGELKELGELGWKEFGVLELTALPSLPEESWLPAVEAADAIIVGGGNGFYLSYWMQESGLAKKLPKLLHDKVYLGVSAGSAIVTQSINVNREELEKTGPVIPPPTLLHAQGTLLNGLPHYLPPVVFLCIIGRR